MFADIKISACDARQLRPALDWLYRDLPAAARPEQVDAAVSDLDPNDVFIATRNDQILGVLVAQPSAGRVGWIGSPVLDSSVLPAVARSEVARLLVEAGVEALGRAGLRLVQALFPPSGEPVDWPPATGFAYVTEVIRMSRSCGSADQRLVNAVALEFVPYGPSTRDAFARVLERTYAESLDIPELDGLRTVEEVIENYQACGQFRPEHWLLARKHGHFVGCILLTHWPDDNRSELQYMGVVPEARRRRVGRCLCVHAIEQARKTGSRELFLSVDDRNEPAARLYKSLGFAEIDRRSLFIRKLTASGGPGST